MGRIVVVVAVVVEAVAEVISSGRTVAGTAGLDAINVQLSLSLGTLTGFTIV
jgi:hypothetical protein